MVSVKAVYVRTTRNFLQNVAFSGTLNHLALLSVANRLSQEKFKLLLQDKPPRFNITNYDLFPTRVRYIIMFFTGLEILKGKTVPLVLST